MQREFQDPWVRRTIPGTNIHIAHGRSYGNPMPLVRQEGSHQLRESNRVAIQHHDAIRECYKDHHEVKLQGQRHAANHMSHILETIVESGWETIEQQLTPFLPREAEPIIKQVLVDTMSLSASCTTEYENFLRNLNVDHAHHQVMENIEIITDRMDREITLLWAGVNT